MKHQTTTASIAILLGFSSFGCGDDDGGGGGDDSADQGDDTATGMDDGVDDDGTAGATTDATSSATAGDDGTGTTTGGGEPDDVDMMELRTTTPLMEGYRFTLHTTLTVEEALENTGEDWQQVDLPHTWNADDAASLTADDYDRGIGWYRLEFPTPTDGTRHWLEIGAASITSETWLNGERLGEHRGAFTKFRYDVTEELADSGMNVLLVRTDNRTPDDEEDATAIDPIGGDFNRPGGLYRHVALISTADRAHFALGDMGGPGVYASTRSIDGSAATLDVRARLANDASEAGDFTLRISLADADGRSAGRVEELVELDGNGGLEIDTTLTIDDVHLWNGMADPYLYRLVADLLDANGNPVDRVVQNFGVREMRFDPDEGFFLNGEPLQLRGVAMHQDYLGRAWAIGEEEMDRSVALIEEIGANFVRLGHYPFPDHIIDRLDELGIVAWAEKPSGLRTTVDRCTEEMPTEEHLVNSAMQLRELIRQQYNHPAISLWSVANETEAGQIYCGEIGGEPTENPFDNVTAYLQFLHEIANEEDPSRPSALAEFTIGQSGAGGGLAFTTEGITDLLGTNRYFLWYTLELEEFSPLLDMMHAAEPDQPLAISEYGAGAAITHHTDNPLGGPPEVRSAPDGETSWQPEEYAAYVHEENWRVISSKDYLFASVVWNMFDFGSAHRNEGDVFGVNTKGMVTFDRETRKDPFWFYKANWSAEPVTYIVGRRYTDRAYAVADVKVYSNANTVQLAVNGTPRGVMGAADCDQRACVFTDVQLDMGDNEIMAIGMHGPMAVPIIDMAEWTLNQTDVNIDSGFVATGWVTEDGDRYGSDNFFVGGTSRYYELGRDAAGGIPDDIDGTEDPMLYKYFRSGDFSYEIPLEPGTYDITLGFMEPDEDVDTGDRLFDVVANGVVLLPDFDVLAEAGDVREAVTRDFTIEVTGDDGLVLAFTPTAGEALVSHMAISPTPGPGPYGQAQ